MSKQDIYQRVTNEMITALEKGTPPWRKPWKGNNDGDNRPLGLPLRSNGVPYSGVNIVLLWIAKEEGDYTSNRWMTYQQAKEVGGQVRKGEKGTTIVYANKFTKTESDADGKETEKQIAFLNTYTVFNVGQVDGLPENLQETASPLPEEESGRIEQLETFYRALPATVYHAGNRAYYHIGTDRIVLPPFTAFTTPQAYYAVRGHETIHWTGHKTRLEREGLGKRYGTKSYAFEELVAELGASFLCAAQGIYHVTRDDHASYLGEWLSLLKDDKKMIFRAAAEAQRAVSYVQDFHASPADSP